jgi:hypothetical protein
MTTSYFSGNRHQVYVQDAQAAQTLGLSLPPSQLLRVCVYAEYLGRGSRLRGRSDKAGLYGFRQVA